MILISLYGIVRLLLIDLGIFLERDIYMLGLTKDSDVLKLWHFEIPSSTGTLQFPPFHKLFTPSKNKGYDGMISKLVALPSPSG